MRGVVPWLERGPPAYGAGHDRRTAAAPAALDRWGPGRHAAASRPPAARLVRGRATSAPGERAARW